ncbi:albusnodin/ikarugamycin family macrolactam cyclase [Streptomyces hydrogenans]|uniref:albusnodin/ikarugamycin family macrolactam cyclase n=1 Tax=Streptomyces hydrogenans TaxID=1873719 RepID=UPI0036C6EEE6
MRWSAGWSGGHSPVRRPAAGRPVTGFQHVWTAEWPHDRVLSASVDAAAVAVVGECAADEEHLLAGLRHVVAGRWAELTRWPGSYTVVARHGESTVVIGDLSGQHPVFFRPEAGGTWWSTAAVPLASLDGAPVDTTALAAHLAFGQPDVAGRRSLFRGVQRVPTGSLLELTPSGARVVRYEPVAYEPVDLRTGAARVQAALREAVALRADGRSVSADLAGLDSTTLACLAAERGPVAAVTFADERLRDDDLTYAARTAMAVDSLRHRIVPGNAGTVYYAGLDDLTHLPVTDAPSAYVVTASIKRAVLDAVVEMNGPGGAHLTGVGGDGVLSAGAEYIADLLRQRKGRRAWSHAQGHARLRRTSGIETFRRALPASRLDLPGGWLAVARELRADPRPWVPQAQRPVAWTPLLTTADWMTRGARLMLASLLDDAAAEVDDAPDQLAVWTERQDLARVGADTAGLRALARHGHGVDIAAPYLDSEVIRACLAVPAQQRGVPYEFKPLLGAAFKAGPVPPFVLERRTKGGFNGVAYAGIQATAVRMRELLGPSSRLATMGLLTEQPVAEALARAVAGQPAPQGAIHSAIAAEVWLRQLDAAAIGWWEEAGDRVAAV